MNRTYGFPKTWKEGRRKRVLELKRYGWKPCEIAAAFGVSAAAVSPWVAEARVRGREAWRAKPRPRGPGKLTSDQVHRI
jgi:transposase